MSTDQIDQTEPQPRRSRRRMRRLGAAIVAAGVLGGGGVAWANHSFPDVPGAAYYHEAVAWAKDSGITTGVGDTGQFMPMRATNRAEVVTFQHRYHEEFNPTQTLLAKVSSTGSLDYGVGVASSTRTATGNYLVTFDRQVGNCAANVTANTIGGSPYIAGIQALTNNTARVRIESNAGVDTNDTFWLTVTCPNAS